MHTSESGTQQPLGTDVFNPPAQFLAWGDKAGTWENRVVVALDSDRTSMSAPELRTGVECYVVATGLVWLCTYGPTAAWEVIGGFPAVGTLAYASGWSNSPSTGGASVSRIGKMVTLQIAFSKATAWVSGETMATIPATFRPGATLPILGNAASGSAAPLGVCQVIVSSTGAISVVPITGASPAQVFGSISYVQGA